MKSSFVYYLLSKYVNRTGDFGLYATLEETTDSHLNNMESLGLEISLNLQITDFTDFLYRAEITETCIENLGARFANSPFR